MTSYAEQQRRLREAQNEDWSDGEDDKPKAASVNLGEKARLEAIARQESFEAEKKAREAAARPAASAPQFAPPPGPPPQAQNPPAFVPPPGPPPQFAPPAFAAPPPPQFAPPPGAPPQFAPPPGAPPQFAPPPGPPPQASNPPAFVPPPGPPPGGANPAPFVPPSNPPAFVPPPGPPPASQNPAPFSPPPVSNPPAFVPPPATPPQQQPLNPAHFSPPAGSAPPALKPSGSFTSPHHARRSIIENPMPAVPEMQGLSLDRAPSGIQEVYNQAADGDSKAFTEKLSKEALDYFNQLIEQPFAAQAIAFLNAYWTEIHTQAEFIFSVAYEMIKYADMSAKGIQLVFNYKEGNLLDFDIGLYFYEQLCKYVEDPKNAATWGGSSSYIYSQPKMVTAIARKAELKKVDCNFDGKVSFLEYLLYQYRKVVSPADFCKRAMAAEAGGDDNAEIAAAMKALEEVQASIMAYEAEKSRLNSIVEKETGVKQLGAKNLLAQIESSPLAENLNAALIKAEAKVRIATKKFGKALPGGVRVGTMKRPSVIAPDGNLPLTGQPVTRDTTSGSIWWMNRDLEEKQKRYGRKPKA